METLTIKRIESPSLAIDMLRLREKIQVPNYQRESFNTTIRRSYNISSKKFTCQRVNDEYFTVTRTR